MVKLDINLSHVGDFCVCLFVYVCLLVCLLVCLFGWLVGWLVVVVAFLQCCICI